MERKRMSAAEAKRQMKAEAERLEVEAFADALAGRAPFPVSVDDAVHGVEALEAIAASANGRRIVTVG